MEPEEGNQSWIVMPGQEMYPKSHWNTAKLLPRKQSTTPETLSLSLTDQLWSGSHTWHYAGSLKYSYVSIIYSLSFQEFPSNAYSYNQEVASSFCWLVQLSQGLLGSKQSLHSIWADWMWQQMLFVAVVHQVSLGSVMMNASVFRIHWNNQWPLLML